MIDIKPSESIAACNLLLQESNAIYHAAATKAGVSDCAFQILYMLQDAAVPCQQSEIAESASLPPQSVNSALKKLEQKGLVTLSGTSRRAGKKITLTESGEAFVEKHITPVRRAENEVVSSFSEEEIETFMRLFETLVKRLNRGIGEAIQEGEAT